MNTLEKQKKYVEPNLILIEGEGKTYESICHSYFSYINNGFNLSVEEVQSYLRCTYQYVIKQIVPAIPHIRITEASRNMLFTYAREYGGIDDDLYSLFYKRILLNRNDFQTFIKEQSYRVIAYQRFYNHQFPEDFIVEVQKKLKERNKKGKPISLEQHFQLVMDSFIWKDFKNEPMVTHSLSYFPEVLYSQNDLIRINGFRYKENFYRMVHHLGLNKIKIGNLVRYSKEEVEEPFLAKMYVSVYKHLKDMYGNNYIQVIQRRALELL